MLGLNGAGRKTVRAPAGPSDVTLRPPQRSDNATAAHDGELLSPRAAQRLGVPLCDRAGARRLAAQLRPPCGAGATPASAHELLVSGLRHREPRHTVRPRLREGRALSAVSASAERVGINLTDAPSRRALYHQAYCCMTHAKRDFGRHKANCFAAAKKSNPGQPAPSTPPAG